MKWVSKPREAPFLGHIPLTPERGLEDTAQKLAEARQREAFILVKARRPGRQGLILYILLHK